MVVWARNFWSRARSHGSRAGMCARQVRARNLRSWLPPAALALAISACGSSAGLNGSPSGSYTTTIAEPGNVGRLIDGTWKATFGKHGSFKIENNRKFGLDTGPGSFYRGTTFQINPPSPGGCGPGANTGTYTLRLTRGKLNFIRLADPCKLRAFILSNRTFTKVG
jgi:hypothetical protein